MHLSSYNLNKGDKVYLKDPQTNKPTLIGNSGDIGVSGSYHLHLAWLKDETDNPVEIWSGNWNNDITSVTYDPKDLKKCGDSNKLQWEYIADLTYDDTDIDKIDNVIAGEIISKQWSIKNSGTEDWINFVLKECDKEENNCKTIGSVNATAGDTITIPVDITIPNITGEFKTIHKLFENENTTSFISKKGYKFFYNKVNVVGGEIVTNKPSLNILEDLPANTNIVLIHGLNSGASTWKTMAPIIANKIVPTNSTYVELGMTIHIPDDKLCWDADGLNEKVKCNGLESENANDNLEGILLQDKFRKKQIRSQGKEHVFGLDRGQFSITSIAWKFSNETNTNSVTNELTKFSHHRVFSINFTNNNQLSFDAQGEQLKAFIDQIAEVTGIDNFILIGHSMGGLAARAYIQNYENIKNIKQLITIDTPHLGGVFAGTYAYKTKNAGVNLAYDSKALASLNNFDQRKYNDIKTFHLGYADDLENDFGEDYYNSGDGAVYIWSQMGLDELNPHRVIFSPETKNSKAYTTEDDTFYIIPYFQNIDLKYANEVIETENYGFEYTSLLLGGVLTAKIFSELPHSTVLTDEKYIEYILNILPHNGFANVYNNEETNLGVPISHELKLNNTICQAFENGIIRYNQEYIPEVKVIKEYNNCQDYFYNEDEIERIIQEAKNLNKDNRNRLRTIDSINSIEDKFDNILLGLDNLDVFSNNIKDSSMKNNAKNMIADIKILTQNYKDDNVIELQIASDNIVSSLYELRAIFVADSSSINIVYGLKDIVVTNENIVSKIKDTITELEIIKGDLNTSTDYDSLKSRLDGAMSEIDAIKQAIDNNIVSNDEKLVLKAEADKIKDAIESIKTLIDGYKQDDNHSPEAIADINSKIDGVIDMMRSTNEVQEEAEKTMLSISRGWNLVSGNVNISTLPQEVHSIWNTTGANWYGYSPHKEIRDEIRAKYRLMDIHIRAYKGTEIVATADTEIEIIDDYVFDAVQSYSKGLTIHGANNQEFSADDIKCDEPYKLYAIFKLMGSEPEVYAPDIEVEDYTGFNYIYQNDGYYTYCITK